MTRRTISTPTTVSGVGLHLGRACELTFRPAASGSGISFRRTDLPGRPTIRARVEEVTATERRTQLGEGKVAIHTVEHVLSAAAALELDDLMIDMSGPEPPILDGSSAPFYDALISADIVEQAGEPEYLTLSEPLRVIDGNSVYEAHPADELSLDVTIEFAHPVIGRQTGSFVVGRESYRHDFAAARTFGFLNEVEELRAKGLIKGASTDNALVLDDTGVVANELRWDDEFLRHKALDCIGDLSLAGARVHARIVAIRPSHRGTVTLVKEMVRAGRRSKSTTKGVSGMAGTMSIEEIMKALPHRYPFLLIDRILEIDGMHRIVGLKNVTINEPFFQGHFPGHPIMPGVLIIEAMAQVGGMMLMRGLEDTEDKVVYFMSLDKVRFRKPVTPGDQIIFELEVLQIRGVVCKMRGVAKVDGELVAEAEMVAMVRDR
ncbi:MAG: bifunctional UDP-3-O-[3-hydroxymyristoyl] N-acetylglucosamine deacetylase/3-hydroxyacyl-ACP dehydratase [Gemmatimonadaceae bacterium]